MFSIDHYLTSIPQKKVKQVLTKWSSLYQDQQLWNMDTHASVQHKGDKEQKVVQEILIRTHIKHYEI